MWPRCARTRKFRWDSVSFRNSLGRETNKFEPRCDRTFLEYVRNVWCVSDAIDYRDASSPYFHTACHLLVCSIAFVRVRFSRSCSVTRLDGHRVTFRLRARRSRWNIRLGVRSIVSVRSIFRVWLRFWASCISFREAYRVVAVDFVARTRLGSLFEQNIWKTIVRITYHSVSTRNNLTLVYYELSSWSALLLN